MYFQMLMVNFSAVKNFAYCEPCLDIARECRLYFHGIISGLFLGIFEFSIFFVVNEDINVKRAR